MKRFLIILGIIIFSLTAVTANAFEYGYTSTGFKYVKHKHSESSYQHAWCSQHKGIEEFENKDFTKAGGSTMSLNERLFLNRLELAEKIKDKSFKVLYV